MDIESLINDINHVNEANEVEFLSDQQKLNDTILDAQALEIRRLQELIEEYEVSEAMFRSKITQCKKKITAIVVADTLQDQRHAIVDAERLVAVMDRNNDIEL